MSLLAQAASSLQLFGPVLLATAIIGFSLVLGRVVALRNVTRAVRANANWAPSIAGPAAAHPLNQVRRARTATLSELLNASPSNSGVQLSPADSASMTLRSERIYL